MKYLLFIFIIFATNIYAQVRETEIKVYVPIRTYHFDRHPSMGYHSTEVGAGNKYIMTRYVTLKTPARWDEYDKYSIDELINLGYDGVVLPDYNRIDYLIFYTESISK